MSAHALAGIAVLLSLLALVLAISAATSSTRLWLELRRERLDRERKRALNQGRPGGWEPQR